MIKKLKIKTWRDHCAELDGSKGVTNKMIQAAMLKHIAALSSALNKERKNNEANSTIKAELFSLNSKLTILENSNTALLVSREFWKNKALNKKIN